MTPVRPTLQGGRGSTKRVAAAVGEGSMAAALAFRRPAELCEGV